MDKPAGMLPHHLSSGTQHTLSIPIKETDDETSHLLDCCDRRMKYLVLLLLCGIALADEFHENHLNQPGLGYPGYYPGLYYGGFPYNYYGFPYNYNYYGYPYAYSGGYYPFGSVAAPFVSVGRYEYLGVFKGWSIIIWPSYHSTKYNGRS